MQFFSTAIITLVLAALTGQALGAPAITAVTKEDTALLERACDCDCNKKCQKECRDNNYFNPINAGICVLDCAPKCGCSEHSKC